MPCADLWSLVRFNSNCLSNKESDYSTGTEEKYRETLFKNHTKKCTGGRQR